MNKPRDIIEQIGTWASNIQEVVATGIKEASFAERILKAELLDESKIEYVPWTNNPMLRLDDDSLLVIDTVGMSKRHPISSVTDSMIPDIADKAYKVIAEGLDEGFLEHTADRITKRNGLLTSRKSEDMLRGDFVNLYNLLDGVEVESNVTLMHKRIFNKVLKWNGVEHHIEAGDGKASMDGWKMVISIKDIPWLTIGNVYVFGAPEQLGRYFVSEPKVILGVTPKTFKVDVEVLTARKWGNVDAVGKSYVNVPTSQRTGLLWPRVKTMHSQGR